LAEGARRSRRFNVGGERVLQIYSLPLFFTLKRHECRAPGKAACPAILAKRFPRADCVGYRFFNSIFRLNPEHFFYYQRTAPIAPYRLRDFVTYRRIDTFLFFRKKTSVSPIPTNIQGPLAIFKKTNFLS
jgi:hypothetical protein